MSPFRNKGWTHFDKLLEIMPNTSARGAHAFSPMNTTIPGQAEEDEDAGGDMSEAAGTSGANNGAKDNIMEVDQDIEGSTLISAPSNKCKLMSDEDDTI